jgi:sialidase-1
LPLLALAKDLEQQAIFSRGQDGYHTYRIPALLTTVEGTVLAFCEGRKNGGGDSGDIDIVLKRSTDGGKTWSKQVTIWDDSTNCCGNPCVVQDQETKTILLLLTHNLGQDHEREINSGKSVGARTVWIMKSDDNGASWSKPQEITSQVKDPSWRWYATGPGVGIQITKGEHKGRIVIPCDHSVAHENEIESQSHAIYSDDHGKTWKLGGSLRPAMNECQVVELVEPKGGLLMSMRNLPRGSNRALATSKDGGITWTEPLRNDQLLDPTQASILRYDWGTTNKSGTILFSNPANSGRRRNMTVRASFDGGTTWPVSKVLHKADAAYSCLSVLPGQEVGCLYECGKTNAYEQITFARFKVSTLER